MNDRWVKTMKWFRDHKRLVALLLVVLVASFFLPLVDVRGAEIGADPTWCGPHPSAPYCPTPEDRDIVLAVLEEECRPYTWRDDEYWEPFSYWDGILWRQSTCIDAIGPGPGYGFSGPWQFYSDDAPVYLQGGHIYHHRNVWGVTLWSEERWEWIS